MDIVTPGFRGRARDSSQHLPPGQYLVHDFPVLSAGPTPYVDTDEWAFTVTTETGERRTWSWRDLMALPQETPTVDLHCVTKWSKLATTWRGVSLDVLLEDVESAADFVLARSYGGYTTNLPLEDLLDGQAWIVHEFDGEPLAPAHGGPARLWSRTCTCGSPPSGSTGSTCSPTTSRASGSSWATTSTATRGASSATPATERPRWCSPGSAGAGRSWSPGATSHRPR